MITPFIVPERFQMSGRIEFVLRDKNGNIKQELKTPNTMCNTGKAQIMGLVNGLVTNFFEYLAIGTGTTAAASTDTALVGQILTRESATCTRQTTVYTNDTARLVYTWTADNTYAVTEAGIFDSSTGGTILARQVFSAINMASGDSLTATWNVSAS